MTIDHSRARKLIQQALGETLSDNQQRRLQAHLQGCPDCRKYAGELEILDNWLRQAGESQRAATPGPNPGLAVAIQKETRSRRMRKQVLAYGGLAVFSLALVALVVFALAALPGGGPTPAQERTPTAASPSPSAPTPTPAAMHETDSLDGQLPMEVYPGLLVFSAASDGGSEIYLQSPVEDEGRNLSADPAWDDQPVWSPDGWRLAFISDRGGQSQILVYDLAQETLVQVASARDVELVEVCSQTLPAERASGKAFFGLAWSPDGSSLVTSLAMEVDGNMLEPLFLVAADGAGLRQLTTGNDVYPQWSPDGGQIAFVRLADCQGGGHDIHAVDPDGRNLVNLTASLASETGETGAFAWSPDGGRIAYFSEAVRADGQRNSFLMVMDAGGAGQEQLADLGTGREFAGSLAWSPDGRGLAYTPPHTADGEYIYWLPLENREPQPLTVQPDHYASLNWSPDGGWLAYTAGVENPAIELLAVTGSQVGSGLTVKQPGGPVYGLGWQPPVSTIAPQLPAPKLLEEIDLDCDGNAERIFVSSAGQRHYFNNNPAYDRLALLSGTGEGFDPAWELTVDKAAVAYFTPQVFPIGECRYLLGVLGDEGPGAGLRVYLWDGASMQEVLYVPGRYLFAGESELASLGLAVRPDSMAILHLQSVGGDNVWTVRAYRWDSESLILDFQKEVRTPSGG